MKSIYLIFCCLLFTGVTNAQSNSFKSTGMDAVCSAVETFSAINQTNNSTDIVWTPSPEAISYTVSYRLLTDTTTYAVSVADATLASLYSLDSCSGYEFYITAVCADFTEIESLHDTFYTRCDTMNIGINSQDFESQLLFYPNPTTGVVSVNLPEPVYGDLILKIYNNVGIIQEEKKYVLNGESRLVNMNDLNLQSGINYFTLLYNGKVKTAQIVVYR
ncbi:MAG: hypothetical protein IPH42_21585 [Bacteroidetes bacterium]|nr:hypothetical protein [Bacteroidota bacterium]